MAQPQWLALELEGMRWRRAKQYARAIGCLTQSLEIIRSDPSKVEDTAGILNYLGIVYLEAGLLELAEATIREALQAIFTLPKEEHYRAGGDYLNLANALSKQGRHREAYEAGKQSLGYFRMVHTWNEPYYRAKKAYVKELRRNLARAENQLEILIPLRSFFARCWDALRRRRPAA